MKQTRELDSSLISSSDYNPEAKEMTLTFKSGKRYTYHNVKPEEHEALVGAESVGSHFRSNFKAHKFTPLD